MRNREEVIKEKQQFLENEMENNKDFEKKISIAERTAAKMRIEWQDAETQRDQFQSEVRLCLLDYSRHFISILFHKN